MLSDAPTFRLELGMAADPATLARWLADAAPGHEAVYASGIDLPRDAAGEG